MKSASAQATQDRIRSRGTQAVIAATYLTVGRGLARDTRWNIASGGNTAGQSLVYQGTDPGLFFSGAFSSDVSEANLFSKFPGALPAVIHPGHGIILEVGTVNVTVNFRFSWRERRAFPGELE